METSKSPVQRTLPPKPTFSAPSQWARSLKSKVVNDASCLATKRLFRNAEVPIDSSEYCDIISDLVRFAHIENLEELEDLKLVLDHMPPDLTELILTDRAEKISEGRQKALIMVLDAVLEKSHTSVKSLYLKYFTLNEAEVKHLSGCIKTNEHLETLGFSFCSFQKDQAALFHHMLVENKGLKSLQLSRCRSALADFAAAFAHNTTLSHLALDGMCSELSDGELLCDPLASNQSLLSLDLHEIVPEPVFTKLFKSLKAHPKLQRLSLSAVKLNDKKALTDLLRSLPELTAVVLPHLALSTDALKAIASLPKIKILDLHGDNEGITENDTLELFQTLKAREALTHLTWASAVMGTACVEYVAGWLKDKDCKLQCLHIDNLLSQSILGAMSFNTSLRELTLRSNHYVASLDIEGLKTNKTLVSLILSGNSMDEAALDHIAPLLKEHPSITEVYLNYCDIDLDGVNAISKLLTGSPAIRSLYLGSNPYGQKGVVQFIHQLQHNKGLVSVYLLPMEGGKMSLSAAESKDVVEGLQKNASLIRLNHRELFKAGTEAQPTILLSREIDRRLRRNVNLNDPVLVKYLQSFMLGFSQSLADQVDIGSLIWQGFVKDGAFETETEMTAAMAMRTVMLGTAPFKDVRAKDLQNMVAGPHEVHTTSTSTSTSSHGNGGAAHGAKSDGNT